MIPTPTFCFALRAGAAAMIAASASFASGVSFNTSIGPGLTALAGTNPTLAANVQAGFAQAQAIWSSHISDPIQINLVLDWEQLDSGTLASTSSIEDYAPYTTVRTALNADRTSANDDTAVAHLPAGSVIAGFTNARDGSKYYTSAPSMASTVMYINRANLKALGILAGNDAGQDATIRFNTLYANSWDFSHTATAGKTDFIGVALHEIGHALGFTSGVSGVDEITGAGPYAAADLNGAEPGIGDGSNIPFLTVLDLFRHSADSNAISSTTIDVATGGSPFFQIDGSTSLGLFSTGEHNGDGRQPSHWKFNTLATMKPSYSQGTVQDLTTLDLTAFDVMGYNLIAVPEPSSLVLATLAGCVLIGSRGLFGPRQRRG